jgi:predicted transcriptional regulator
MAIKEAKNLELLPRLSANEKRVFTVLTKYGVGTTLEIAQRSNISKGRVPAVLETMIQRGFVVPLKADDEGNRRYAAVYPITRFIQIVDRLISSLEARTSEWDSTTQIVYDFTENAIRNVREASMNERQKRTDRSEEDIKDMEMAMDASFSGILASVEMDLKDLGKIAQTSNEFLTESSIRTDETCANISRALKPLEKNFSDVLGKAQTNVFDKLEETVDARVSNVIDFETKALGAFDEVLDAFKSSQDAFEDIVFNVLDSGIVDLEKVTRPINEQIEEAISSLTVAVREASNYFQAEILRVFIEQKRPMITCLEKLRPLTTNVIERSYVTQNDILSEQFQEIGANMESHTSIFSEALEQLAKEFNNRVANLIDQTDAGFAAAKDEIIPIETKYKETTQANLEEKNQLLHTTSNKTREVLNEMMEQFILILNRSVAQYQMDLGDMVAKLESDFLSNVDNHGTGIQNIVNYINISLVSPIQFLMKDLDKLNEQIEKEESDFLGKFEKTLTEDLLRISQNFNNETKKKEDSLDKEVSRVVDRFDKEIDNNHDLLKSRLSSSQKKLQSVFKEFSNEHQKELRTTRKEVDNLTKKLERWRGESVTTLTQHVNTRVNESMSVLSSEINGIIARIENKGQVSEDELIRIIKESYNDISGSFKDFGNNVTNLLQNSLDDVGNTLKSDSLTINNRLVQFKKEQDKLIDETKEPSFKLIDEIKDDYNDLYKKLIGNIKRFFTEELDAFKKSRSDVGKSLENVLNRRGSRTSREIDSLKQVFDKTRENNVRKTQNSFEDIEKNVAREASELIDQERNTRSTIINLTERIIKDLTDSVNSTAQTLRTSLWDGSESIFGQAAAEINKQEIELNTINDKQLEESINSIQELTGLVREQLDAFKQKTTILQDKQIEDVYEFKNSFTRSLDEDLLNRLDSLKSTNEELVQSNNNAASELREVIDVEVSKSVQELETKTTGIEGAIYSTVSNITAETSRRTEGLMVVGEQAVLGIEERYTENLEDIRQKLTDEVVTRIEEEAKRIEGYKDGLRDIGREHRTVYGTAMTELHEALKTDLKDAEEATLRTISNCESISCRFLKDLDLEINAMGDRVVLSTERLTDELLTDFDRVLQKVKREVALFARKQFELSNKSNHEIAEAFLKSVDDLEEVMLKQIESFTQRTNMSMEKTTELANIVNDNIKDISGSFKELVDN